MSVRTVYEVEIESAAGPYLWRIWRDENGLHVEVNGDDHELTDEDATHVVQAIHQVLPIGSTLDDWDGGDC